MAGPRSRSLALLAAAALAIGPVVAVALPAAADDGVVPDPTGIPARSAFPARQ